MPGYYDRWMAAKTQFTTKTGVSKPKPKGLFNNFFNHTSLASSIGTMDAAIDALVNAKPNDQSKLLKAAKAALKPAQSAITTYVKVLDKSAQAEQFDNNGDKTVVYRELKLLKAELAAISAQAEQKIDGVAVRIEVGEEGGTLTEMAAKMANKGLASACAVAVLAVKKVKADPTPATYNAVFRIQDSPARKIRVQMISLQKEIDENRLPDGLGNVNLRHVTERMMPWNEPTSPKSGIADTASKEDVLARLGEFTVLLKLCTTYSAALAQYKA